LFMNFPAADKIRRYHSAVRGLSTSCVSFLRDCGP
jgi:hypothetical protein